MSGRVSIENSVVRRYVLGDLTEEESQRLEEEYFASDERFGQLLAVEEDLIEDFLQDRLSAGDRERFTARFMTTDRGWQKVAAQKLAQTPKARSSKRILPIAAAVMTLAIGVAVFREFVEMRRQIDHLQRERATLRSDVASLSERLRVQPLRTVESVFSIALTSSPSAAAKLTHPRAGRRFFVQRAKTAKLDYELESAIYGAEWVLPVVFPASAARPKRAVASAIDSGRFEPGEQVP